MVLLMDCYWDINGYQIINDYHNGILMEYK